MIVCKWLEKMSDQTRVGNPSYCEVEIRINMGPIVTYSEEAWITPADI